MLGPAQFFQLPSTGSQKTVRRLFALSRVISLIAVSLQRCLPEVDFGHNGIGPTGEFLYQPTQTEIVGRVPFVRPFGLSEWSASTRQSTRQSIGPKRSIERLGPALSQFLALGQHRR